MKSETEAEPYVWVQIFVKGGEDDDGGEPSRIWLSEIKFGNIAGLKDQIIPGNTRDAAKLKVYGPGTTWPIPNGARSRRPNEDLSKFSVTKKEEANGTEEKTGKAFFDTPLIVVEPEPPKRASEREPEGASAPEHKKMKASRASLFSASTFANNNKAVLEGVGAVPTYPLKQLVPAHVKKHFDPDFDSTSDPRIQEICNFFTEVAGGGPITLKTIQETGDQGPALTSVQLSMDELVQTNIFEGRVSTERQYNDGLARDGPRSLGALEAQGGIATSESPPDGYFHTGPLTIGLKDKKNPFFVTGLIECKGSASSTLFGTGEGVAHATNVAVAMYKAGIPIDRIVVPIVCLTGTHAQFFALYLLEPCFPCVCCLTRDLRIADPTEDGNLYGETKEAAKYFLAMLEYTKNLETDLNNEDFPLTPPNVEEILKESPSLMRLDLERYHLKSMRDFFEAGTNLETSLHYYFKMTARLHDATDVACLPIAIRLGGTKGGVKENDEIVFENLLGYGMGFPKEEEDRPKLVAAIADAVSTLHRKKVIHMDLCMSNILWKKKEDGSFSVKIIDFDAAQGAEKDQFTKGVGVRLLSRECQDLLKLFGAKPAKGFDTMYVEIYQKHMLDEDAPTAEGDAKNMKKKLDLWCKSKVEDYLEKKLGS